MNENLTAANNMTASAGSLAGIGEAVAAHGVYTAVCRDAAGNIKWTDTFDNLVTTVGKNDLLDKYLTGSAYTAAFYMGLISSVSYTAIVAADTAASHTGWTEAGGTNAPTYSNAARITTAWSAASAGAKALSASLTFIFNGAGTIKGSFLSTIATKDTATGTLFSAGLFTGGDKIVASSDQVSVSYSLSV